MFVFLPQDRSNFVCTKCKQVSILEEKVQGLEKQVSTLRCIRENEDFLDRCQDMFLRAQHSEESEQVVQWGQKDGEENWQHVTSRKRKRSVHVPAMQIQESQTLQDIVEQPADTSAISILKNHYPKITVTLKKMFPASGERKSPVKTIGSELRKSKERTEMSQSSAITLKKIFPASGERKSPEKKMEAQFNLLNEKLGSVQKHLEVQLQNPLLVLEAQIIQLRNQLSSIDEKVSQEGEKKLKTIECMRFANRDELKVQEWRYLPEKKEISHLEKKLEQLMNTGKRGQIRLHLHQSYTSPLCL
nr:uncharacterized protein LOC101937062 isoform X2 [Chrysemys picta bellii]